MLTVFFLPSVFAGDLGHTINIHPVAIIHKEQVYLSDIADIKETTPHNVQQRIKETPLWEAPHEIGEVKVYSAPAIRRRMQEVLGKNAIFCQYPATLTIQRGGSIYYRDEIKEKVLTSIVHLLEKEYQGKVEIEHLRLPEYILTKEVAGTLNITMKRHSVQQSTFTIDIIDIQGKKVQSVPASLTSKVFRSSLCAKGYIERGSSLEGQLVHCTYNASLENRVLNNEEEQKLYRAKRSIEQGDVIRYTDIEKIPAIQKGMVIELIYTKEGIYLSTKAQALHDARIGERIRVQPPYSKHYVYAVVVDAHRVQIK